MKKSTLSLLISIMMVTALPQSLVAGDGGVKHKTAAEAPEVIKSEIEGIYNYSRSGDETGFGGATDPSAMNALKEQGYHSVINLRLADEDGVDVPAARMAASQAGLEYIHLPFDSSNPDPKYFENFLAAVDNEVNQPVYLHCGSATRVAALWMTKRVIADGWTLDAAEKEARSIAGKPDAAVAFATKYIQSKEK